MVMPTQDEVNRFLDALRETGAVNMFGAAPVVAKQFDIPLEEAITLTTEWMKTYHDRKATE